MNKKVIRTIAAVTAAALLGGGIYLLVKNDVAQKINWRDILIYAPTKRSILKKASLPPTEFPRIPKKN